MLRKDAGKAARGGACVQSERCVTRVAAQRFLKEIPQWRGDRGKCGIVRHRRGIGRQRAHAPAPSIGVLPGKPEKLVRPFWKVATTEDRRAFSSQVGQKVANDDRHAINDRVFTRAIAHQRAVNDAITRIDERNLRDLQAALALRTNNRNALTKIAFHLAVMGAFASENWAIRDEDTPCNRAHLRMPRPRI